MAENYTYYSEVLDEMEIFFNEGPATTYVGGKITCEGGERLDAENFLKRTGTKYSYDYTTSTLTANVLSDTALKQYNAHHDTAYEKLARQTADAQLITRDVAHDVYQLQKQAYTILKEMDASYLLKNNYRELNSDLRTLMRGEPVNIDSDRVQKLLDTAEREHPKSHRLKHINKEIMKCFPEISQGAAR